MASRRVFQPGERSSPEYTSWRGMKQRCCNPKDPRYDLYGGRGIKIYPDWKYDYFAFLRDMGRKPSPRHTLDRIDSSKGYYPGNCRWADPKQQARNTRRKRSVTVNGVSKNLSQWSEESGVHPNTIGRRLKEGWDPQDAVFTPPTIDHRYLTVHGLTKTLTEWSREYQVDYTTIIHRLKRGWSDEEAVLTPSGTHPESREKSPNFLLVIKHRKLKDLLCRKSRSLSFRDPGGDSWTVSIMANGDLHLEKSL